MIPVNMYGPKVGFKITVLGLKGVGMVKKIEEVELFLRMCCDTSVLRFDGQELALQDTNEKPEDVV